MKNTIAKDFVLAAIAALSEIAVFWLWYQAIPSIISGELKSLLHLIAPVFGLALSGAFLVFAGMFIRNPYILYGTGIIGTSAPYFFVEADGVVLSVLALSLLFILAALHRIRKEFMLALGFNLGKIFRAGIPLYFTIASLMVAIFYLALVDEETAIPSLLPKSTLNFTLNRLSEPLSAFTGIPKISPEETIDEVLLKLLKEQLQEQGIAFSQIPKQELQQAIIRERHQIAEQYGIKISGNEKVVDIFYNAVTERMKDLLGPYKQFIPFASAIAFFFAFKALTLPLYYLSFLISFLLIKILEKAKIVRKEKMQIEIEKLSLT